ncbi:MAG TPA: hypothetical protein DCY79_01995 [Planctomycetaceae bacterium]|nr:hypothetical protein [Blastopirellula sp.]HAY78560.1 hypothetical protein [Planctomycetaceae bacterium]
MSAVVARRTLSLVKFATPGVDLLESARLQAIFSTMQHDGAKSLAISQVLWDRRAAPPRATPGSAG